MCGSSRSPGFEWIFEWGIAPTEHTSRAFNWALRALERSREDIVSRSRPCVRRGCLPVETCHFWSRSCCRRFQFVIGTASDVTVENKHGLRSEDVERTTVMTDNNQHTWWVDLAAIRAGGNRLGRWNMCSYRNIACTALLRVYFPCAVLCPEPSWPRGPSPPSISEN